MGTSLTSPSSTHSYLACRRASTSAWTASELSRWIALSHASPMIAHSSPSSQRYMQGSPVDRTKPMPPSARGRVRWPLISALQACPADLRPYSALVTYATSSSPSPVYSRSSGGIRAQTGWVMLALR